MISDKWRYSSDMTIAQLIDTFNLGELTQLGCLDKNACVFFR